MSDIAFSSPPPRRVLRTIADVLLGGLMIGVGVVLLVASGTSLDFAIGCALGRISRDGPAPRMPSGESERALRLGRKMRAMLGLDARAARREAARQVARDRIAAKQALRAQRRHEAALRRAAFVQRLRDTLRRAVLLGLAGIGALAVVAVLVTALVQHLR